MGNLIPSFVSEEDLNKRFGTFGFLASGGRYGCGAALFEGDLVDESGALLFSDEWFRDLNDQHPNDVGTVLVTGNVRSEQKLFVSDRLMCLIVLGSLTAPALSIFETETWVGGDLVVGSLTDRDDYLQVKGERTIARRA